MMAGVLPVAASCHQRPSQLSPFPLCVCSSSAVPPEVRFYSTHSTAGGSNFSSSAFSSAFAGKSRGSAGRYVCFVEERSRYLYLCPRSWLTSPRGSCLMLWDWERNGGIGWWRRMLRAASVCCMGMGGSGKVGVKVKQVDGERYGSSLDLEAEIFDFMEKSTKPNSFPTKDELLAAGRLDLVEAVVSHGGWLIYGWDMDGGGAAGVHDCFKKQQIREELKSDSWGSSILETNLVNMRQEENFAGWLDTEILKQQRFSYTIRAASSSSSPISLSDRTMETEGVCDSGIEGILKGLEKERDSMFMVGLKNKEVDNEPLLKENDLRTVNDMTRGRESISLDLKCRFLPDFDGGEVLPNGNISEVENFDDTYVDDCEYTVDHDANEKNYGSKKPISVAVNDQSQMHSHLQRLEGELSSVLDSLMSTSEAIASQKSQEGSLKELHTLSNAWEFQETEIMNAHDKLRATKGKLAILGGKMAIEMTEAQKIVDEKQRKVDAAQRALRHLRSTYVVWPNSASEVLLAGSFDGWFSQRKMERSSTGIFSLHLKLYPGQYEIKFIVDGIWKIDPLRPIVHNNGFENNLLIIS